MKSENVSVIFARARYLIPMTKANGRLVRIEDGYILTSSTIIEIGKFSTEIGLRILEDYRNNLQIIGSKVTSPELKDMKLINGVILPGFIKGHGHDHESALIGVARDVPLTDWLDQAVNIFTGLLHENENELQEKLGKSPYAIAYLKARLDDIQFGITSAITHHCNFNKYHVKELVDANELAGTRIYIAVGSQDRNYDSRILDTADKAIERLDAYEEKFGHLTRTSIIPGPDQLFSNGPGILKALKTWSTDHNKLIHIHSSEEPGTTKWFTEKYGMSPIEYAESIGFLDENTILAHQVNTSAKDLKILQITGAKVVHNPLANTILGSGMPPILDMMKNGIPVCFSTDGSGSADNQNILAAARLAAQYQKALHQNARVIDAEEALMRITVHAADILQLNAGELSIGKDGDFVVFDLSNPNINPTRKETVVENLIWASAGNEIKFVIADGKVLLDNYEFTTINKNEILKDINALAYEFAKYKERTSIKSETGIRGN